MSKSYYLSANISPTYATFASWLTKTNTILYDMGTYVVTTDTTTSGGTTTGNAYVNGFFSANTLVAQDALRGGNISSNGVLNIISNTVVNNSILTVGNSTFYTQSGYIPSQLSVSWNQVSVNNYTQIALVNVNNGVYASGDLVVYNDTGYTSQNIYVDMGINSSGFTGAGTWTINGPNDGYLYSGNSNLSVGTANNNYINFFTNGTLAASEKMRIVANGFVGIGNTAPDALLKVQGTANIIGNTFISGTLNVASTGYFQNNVTVLGTLTTSGSLGISTLTGSVANTFVKISGSNTVTYATIALGDLSNVTGVGSPTSGYVLAWNGSSWTATNPSGISAAVNSNTIIIANTAQIGGNSTANYILQVNGNTTAGYIIANSANITLQSTANVQIIGSANVTGSVYGTFVGGITGNVTGNANTSTKWVAPINVTVAGDVVNSSATSLDGSTSITINTILSNTAVTPGTYGNSTAYPVITVDSKGRLTAVSNQSGGGGGVASFNTRSGAVTLTAADVTSALTNVVQTNTAPVFTVPVVISNTANVASLLTLNGGLAMNNTGITMNAVSIVVTGGDVTSRDVFSGRNTSVANAVFTGSATVNTTMSGTSLVFANTTATVTINATSYGGSANNASYLGGTAAASYALQSYVTGLGFANSTNGASINGNASNITGTYGGTITSTQVTNGLGYTPYNSSNPSGFIASSGGTFSGGVTFNASVALNNALVMNANNGAGYSYNWQLGTGSTSKYLRTNPTSGLEFINNAYNSVIATLTDAGSFNAGNLTVGSSGYQVLHAANYTSYSPSLTGSGASGTWGINVTGNASNITGTYGGTITSTQVTNGLGYTPPSLTGSGASGTWGINVTGSSGSVSGVTLQGGLGTSSSTQFGSLGIGTSASGTSGEIRATNNITAYYSDYRLKTNITVIPNALAKVMAISGVTFQANELAGTFGYTDKKKQVGVIAQEIEKVLPEIVVPAPFDIAKDEDGTEYSRSGENFKTVQYEKLVPLLIEAIKELKNEVDELRAKLNDS